MIRFRCKCSNWLNVQDDMSGESIQCPKCGLLVDVPSLDELPNIAEDGTIKIGKPLAPMAHQDGRLRDVPAVTNRQDTKDRRQTLEEFLELDNHIDEVNQPTARPKLLYDPLTGQLIEPLGVKPADPHQPAAPQPTDTQTNATVRTNKPVRTLGYARPGASGNAPQVLPAATFLTMWWRLLVEPANVVVVVVMTLAITAVIFFAKLPLIGLVLSFLFAIPAAIAIVAHFGNVIDETGPTGRDELPAPLRNASLYDDLWLPFLQVCQAAFVSFLPIWVIQVFHLPVQTEVWLAIYLLCYFPLPAMLVTAVCSGFWSNMLPHRSLPVTWVSGVSYLWAVTATFFATHVFLLGAAMVVSTANRVGTVLMYPLGLAPATPTMFAMPRWMEMTFALPVLLLGVWLLHGACWTMGLIYRRYHQAFPWTMQRHISTRNDTQAQLLRMRRQGVLPTPAQRQTKQPAPGNVGPVR